MRSCSTTWAVGFGLMCEQYLHGMNWKPLKPSFKRFLGILGRLWMTFRQAIPLPVCCMSAFMTTRACPKKERTPGRHITSQTHSGANASTWAAFTRLLVKLRCSSTPSNNFQAPQPSPSDSWDMHNFLLSHWHRYFHCLLHLFVPGREAGREENGAPKHPMCYQLSSFPRYKNCKFWCFFLVCALYSPPSSTHPDSHAKLRPWQPWHLTLFWVITLGTMHHFSWVMGHRHLHRLNWTCNQDQPGQSSGDCMAHCMVLYVLWWQTWQNFLRATWLQDVLLDFADILPIYEHIWTSIGPCAAAPGGRCTGTSTVCSIVRCWTRVWVTWIQPQQQKSRERSWSWLIK